MVENPGRCRSHNRLGLSAVADFYAPGPRQWTGLCIEPEPKDGWLDKVHWIPHNSKQAGAVTLPMQGLQWDKPPPGSQEGSHLPVNN